MPIPTELPFYSCRPALHFEAVVRPLPVELRLSTIEPLAIGIHGRNSDRSSGHDVTENPPNRTLARSSMESQFDSSCHGAVAATTRRSFDRSNDACVLHPPFSSLTLS